ncbi:MAG: hypothetical protein WA117_26120 [Verrucomicrobiia bacterium]
MAEQRRVFIQESLRCKVRVVLWQGAHRLRLDRTAFASRSGQESIQRSHELGCAEYLILVHLHRRQLLLELSKPFLSDGISRDSRYLACRGRGFGTFVQISQVRPFWRLESLNLKRQKQAD